MLKLLKSIGCVAVLALSASQASAGVIVASGDSNLDLGDITGLNTFYATMFGGSDVFATSGFSVANTQAYMSANSASFTLGSVSTSALVGMEWLVASSNNTYSAGELADVASFVSGGGSLFVIGEEPNDFAFMNVIANSLLAAVGSSMTIGQPQSASTTWAATGANIGSDSLTTGVLAFGGNYAATVSGGTMLFRSDSTGEVILAVEGATTNQVPEPTSLALLVLGLLGFTAARRSKK